MARIGNGWTDVEVKGESGSQRVASTNTRAAAIDAVKAAAARR